MAATATHTSANTFDYNSPKIQALVKDSTSWKFPFFLLWKLPSALFMGLRIRSLTPERCTVTLPHGWRSQNPFKSTYFAAQVAAAEMSTGAIALMGVRGRGKIGTLVTNIEAEFVKQGMTKTTFTCDDGLLILDAIQRAIDTGEKQTITITSIGTDEHGDVVSRFKISWGIKKIN